MPPRGRIIVVEHPGAAHLPVGIESSRAMPPSALSEKAPHLRPPAPRQGRALSPHPLPAGGTTAGLPSPSPANRPAGPSIGCYGTFCVNMRDRPRRGGTQKAGLYGPGLGGRPGNLADGSARSAWPTHDYSANRPKSSLCSMNTRSAAQANSSSEASLALVGKSELSDSIPPNSAERSVTATMTLARSAAGNRRISSMTSATLIIPKVDAGTPQRQRPSQPR